MNNAEGRSVSLYNWIDVEKRAKKLNLDRSKYIQKLVNKDINKKIRVTLVELSMFLILALIVVLIVVVR